MKNKFIALMMALALSTSCFAANGPTPLQSAVSSFWSEFNDDVIYTEKSVGIGTSTPDVTKALHVVGDVKVGGPISISDGAGTSVSDMTLILGSEGDSGYAVSGSTVYYYANGALCWYTSNAAFNAFNSVASPYFNTSGGTSREYNAFSKTSDTNTGIGFPSADTMWFNNNGIETMRTTADNNVLIGTTVDDDDAKLAVEGYTKLGDAAIPMMMKEVTGTTSSTEGGQTLIAHGLTSGADRIRGITLAVEYSANNYVGKASGVSGYNAGVLWNDTNVIVSNNAGDSSNILSKPVTVTVWYTD